MYEGNGNNREKKGGLTSSISRRHKPSLSTNGKPENQKCEASKLHCELCPLSELLQPAFSSVAAIVWVGKIGVYRHGIIVVIWAVSERN